MLIASRMRLTLSSSLDRSARTYAAEPRFLARASPVSTELREWSTTEYPSCDSRRAIAAPIPEVEPVIRATGADEVLTVVMLFSRGQSLLSIVGDSRISIECLMFFTCPELANDMRERAISIRSNHFGDYDLISCRLCFEVRRQQMSHCGPLRDTSSNHIHIDRSVCFLQLSEFLPFRLRHRGLLDDDRSIATFVTTAEAKHAVSFHSRSCCLRIITDRNYLSCFANPDHLLVESSLPSIRLLEAESLLRPRAAIAFNCASQK